MTIGLTIETLSIATLNADCCFAECHDDYKFVKKYEQRFVIVNLYTIYKISMHQKLIIIDDNLLYYQLKPCTLVEVSQMY